MDQSALVAQFVGATTASTEVAQAYLAKNGWDLEEAVSDYCAAMETEGKDDTETEAASNPFAPGSRSIGSSGSQATPTAPSQSRPQSKKKFGSIRDLQGEAGGGDGHAEDDDNDQKYFAGGDKSGLAVQEPGTSGGPSDQIQRLLETARRNAPRPAQEDDEPRQTNFRGHGQTLGGDDEPSRVVEDPNASRAQPPEMVERILHLWSDGFSVDDGPLFRYDDPANARTLEMINRGSAPLEIMNVEPGQAVDVKLNMHRGENYVQPKKQWKPFSGSGQRLGSPAPGSAAESSLSTADATMTNAASTLDVTVDSSLPTITLQIRLADGTRLPSRFNTTHTIGDVYDFVNRSNPGSGTRAYILATTFPTKDLDDRAQVLGDLAEFKRGGVIVQKWA